MAERPAAERPTRRALALVRWGLVVAWAGMTWVLSSIPDLKSDLPEDFVLRKIAHALEFGVLALLVRSALPERAGRTAKRAVIDLRDGYAGLAALAYALVDELHQTFVPGRHGAATDVLIDGAGVVLALLLAAGWRRYRR